MYIYTSTHGLRHTANTLRPAIFLSAAPHDAKFHATHHQIVVQLVRCFFGRLTCRVCDKCAV